LVILGKIHNEILNYSKRCYSSTPPPSGVGLGLKMHCILGQTLSEKMNLDLQVTTQSTQYNIVGLGQAAKFMASELLVAECSTASFIDLDTTYSVNFEFSDNSQLLPTLFY